MAFVLQIANCDVLWLATTITTALGANPRIIASFIPLLPHPIFLLAVSSNPTSLAGILALHIRRGDFIEHCLHLAN